MHLKNIVRDNCIDAVASQAERRAMRAPESEKQFWLNREAALRCSANLSERGAEITRRLDLKHASNPKFQTLCANLH